MSETVILGFDEIITANGLTEAELPEKIKNKIAKVRELAQKESRTDEEDEDIAERDEAICNALLDLMEEKDGEANDNKPEPNLEKSPTAEKKPEPEKEKEKKLSWNPALGIPT